MAEIKLFKRFDKELEKQWLEIEKNAEISFFQTYDWNKLWFNNVGIKKRNIELCILVFKENDLVTDILPLCAHRNNFIKKIEFIGGLNTDYKNIISTKRSILNNYKFGKIEFKKLLNDNLPDFDIAIFSNILIKNENENNLLNLLEFTKINDNFQIKLNNLNFDYYFNNFLKKKFSADINRQIKRLKKIGNLEFKVFTKYNDVKKYTLEMIKLKREQYKKTPGSLFDIDGYEQMYKKYSDTKDNKYLHLSGLFLDNEIISIHYGFLFKNTFYYIMPSYNKIWYKYSPGNVLIYYLIDECIKKRINFFDFTDGVNRYKQNWSNKKYEIFECILPNTFKGQVYIKILKFVNILKKNDTIRKIFNKKTIY